MTPRTRMLIAAFFASIILAVLLSLTETPIKDIANSIEIVDFKSKWVQRYGIVGPHEVLLVPAISFRVKNIGDKPLKYINFNAVFIRKPTGIKLGSAFIAGIRGKALKPGEVSDPIEMVSVAGYIASSLKAFIDNPFWEPVECKLFVNKGEEFALIGVFDVEQRIEGLEDLLPAKTLQKGLKGNPPR